LEEKKPASKFRQEDVSPIVSSNLVYGGNGVGKH